MCNWRIPSITHSSSSTLQHEQLGGFRNPFWLWNHVWTWVLLWVSSEGHWRELTGDEGQCWSCGGHSTVRLQSEPFSSDQSSGVTLHLGGGRVPHGQSIKFPKFPKFTRVISQTFEGKNVRWKQIKFQMNIIVFHLRRDHYMKIFPFSSILLLQRNLSLCKANTCNRIIYHLVLHFDLIIWVLQHPLKNCDTIKVDQIYECFMKHTNMEGTPWLNDVDIWTWMWGMCMVDCSFSFGNTKDHYF